MLRVIMLSLVWAICSTCLVRPWFWKGVINKTLVINYEEKRIGFTKSWKSEIVAEIFAFTFIFMLSMAMYLVAGKRYTLSDSYIMIIICFLAQCLWSYQGKVRYGLFLSFALILFILFAQDSIATSNIQTPLNKVESIYLTIESTQIQDENTIIKLFVSADEIKNLFHANSVSGPTCNNGKYIFIVSGGSNGYGVVIIDQRDYKKAKFISCPHKFEIVSIRPDYPTLKLKEVFVAISDDNVPYGVFAVAEKEWFFGNYNVTQYLLFNLTSGESQIFSPKELPEFVTNNN